MAKVGLSLTDYWLIIRKRRWIVIFCFLVIFLTVIINIQTLPSIYKAICSIRVIERKSVSDMITQMVSYTTYDIMSSLTKILCGRPVIEKVVYELGLADKNTPREKLENIILGIQNSVKTEKEAETNIVNIIVQHTDPSMAAKIANTIAKVYIRVDMEEKNERRRNLRIFLEEQVAKAKQRLAQAEEKIKTFREKGEVTGIAVSIENDIVTLERQKMDLRKIFTEKYPDVIKINEQIENLKKELQALPETELEYARLTRELGVSERSYQLLHGKLDEARIAEAESSEDVKIVNPATVPKTPIRPNKRLMAIMGLVVGLVIGVFASFVVETLDTSIGTIEDIETLLELPVLAVIPYMGKKSEKKNIWKWLTGRLLKKDKDKSEQIKTIQQQLLIKYTQKSSTTEAYRILRTNMKIEELLKNNQRVLLITSAIPMEGKSITALNLAFALAQDGYRTLLIDCDLRKAIIHKVFNIEKEPGLTDILLGTSKPEIAIKNFIDLMISDPEMKDVLLRAPGMDNFNILPCGKIVDNPVELLDSAKIKELFSDLEMQYNFLVIDSPPVLPVPDTIILGRKAADKLYLLYRTGYTSKIAISRAKEQLNMMGALPAGIILNSTTPESQIVSNYYHHYYHYRYYAEKEDKK